MTNIDLTFPAFTSRFVYFSVQFCFLSTKKRPLEFKNDSGVILMDQSLHYASSICGALGKVQCNGNLPSDQI